MKKLILIFFLFSSLIIHAQETVRVLFIGNSFTFTHDAPALLRKLAETQGHRVITSENCIGGYSFQTHAAHEKTRELIRKGNYDYVLLQGYSREMTHNIEILREKTFPYVKQLMDSIHEYAPNATPIFFMTWGYKDGTTIAPTPFDNFEDMNAIIQQRYEKLAQHYHCWVAPIGAAWAAVRFNYPDINLYASDNYHPSPAGEYLVASTLYSMIFNEECKSSFHFKLSSTDAANIQYTTSITVGSSLERWKNTAEPKQFRFMNDLPEMYPNPAQTSISFNLPCDHATISVVNLLGKEVARFNNVKMPFRTTTGTIPDGVYFVKMNYSNSSKIERLIIKR
ncbi:MAG: T9SS type A sorting domain-containing protein [Bacteroidales bacterium]|jgi:hypothetical protein|nr:T9SS type A sorting domain-containing protein [Bacteroidales bacterium]